MATISVMPERRGENSHADSLLVFSTLSAHEALKELIPRFESETGLNVEATYAGGSVLSKQLANPAEGDLFIGPEGFTGELIAKAVLRQSGQQALVRSATGLAVQGGTPRPDTSTVEEVKKLLLWARSVSYSPGASGIHFIRLLEKLGIADAVARKTVLPLPGELVGGVVARGAAQIGVQQISELLPVAGIQILQLPDECQQTILYTATLFARAPHEAAAQAFVSYLRSNAVKAVWRRKGLEPL